MSFLGDVFSAIGDAFSAVAKVVAPVELVIDAGAKLLGLPPAFADAVKVGVGALTEDWVLVADGAKSFIQDVAGDPATTEYSQGSDAAAEASGWSSEGTSSAAADGSSKSDATGPSKAARRSTAVEAEASSEDDSGADDAAVTDASSAADAAEAASLDDDDAQALAAFRLLLAHFDDLDQAGGPILGIGPSGVISRDELQRISEDPSASIELKRAVRYLLDHPETFDKFGRSKGPSDVGLSRVDLKLAIEDLGGAATSGATPGLTPGGSSSPASTSSDPASSDEAQAAFVTLRQYFDEVDRTLRVGKMTIGLTPDLITRGELQRVSDDVRSPGALKQAARYVLDHPDLWSRLARSRGDLPIFQGIARGDLDAAIAAHGVPGRSPGPAPASGGTGTSPAGGTPKKTPSSSGSGSSSGSASSTGRGALRDILKDKSLSNEEKLEAILLVLIDESDNKLVNTAKELDDAAAKRDKLKTNDKDKLSKLDKLDRDLNFKLQRLTERKQKLETLLSNMEQKFTQMAMTAIVNIGR